MSDENSLYSGTVFADFVWKIANFSYIKNFGPFYSEKFVVDSNLSFQLKCRGNKLWNVTVKIFVPNEQNRPAQTQLRFELFLLDNAGLTKRRVATTFFDYFRNFKPENELTFLESDIDTAVTIRCRIYWNQACKTRVSRLYLHTFDWRIDEFLSIGKELHLKQFTDSQKSLKLKICNRENENKLIFTTEDADDFYISKCIFKIKNTDMYLLNHDNPLKLQSKKDNVLQLLISQKNLMENYFFSVLNCKLLISHVKLHLQNETSATTSENNRNGSGSVKNKQPRISEDNTISSVRLTAEILKMYQEGLMSDFTVKVGTREFPTHMCVLSARSPVIRRMLETDMKEKQQRKLTIVDTEEDTVQRMLDYIYTDNPGELDLDSASKLYSAANMYEIAGLTHDCKVFLKQIISISNVCEILSLADLHSDQELKSSAIGFISEHEEEVVLCKEFEAFSKDNPQLSVEVLLGVARLRIQKS